MGTCPYMAATKNITVATATENITVAMQESCSHASRLVTGGLVAPQIPENDVNPHDNCRTYGRVLCSRASERLWGRRSRVINTPKAEGPKSSPQKLRISHDGFVVIRNSAADAPREELESLQVWAWTCLSTSTSRTSC